MQQTNENLKKKVPSDNIRCAFATALLCLIWALIADWTGLPCWAGFAGCTAYFAAPGKGWRSIPVTLLCVISGILYASLSLFIGQMTSVSEVGFFMTFLTTFLMCAAGVKKMLAFVPGAFIGSFSTFAGAGEFTTIAAIMIGVFLGLACDSFGKLLCKIQ